MVKNIYDRQIQNRNFLSPTGFLFTLNRAPKVSFFSNSANIPDISLGVAEQPSYLTDIPHPGDKMVFGDFTIRFLIDEDLENYMEIQNWMRGLGFPESLQEIYDLQKEESGDRSLGFRQSMNVYSDGTLQVLTSNNVPNFKVKFRDMFPVSLSTLNFDATMSDVEYFTADVTFRYTMYNIVTMSGDPL